MVSKPDGSNIKVPNECVKGSFSISQALSGRNTAYSQAVDGPCCEIRAAAATYLGSVSKNLDCPSILVGGVEDHVHLLCRFGRSIAQAEWVKELKRVSNLWLQEQGPHYADFQWQGGYADFSVSQSNLEEVKRYIAGQEEHHRKLSFQDELRALLRRHDIEWDERYVWD
jgi:REP element-mobilizing transposase RayT